MPPFKEMAEGIGLAIDGAGIFVIIAGLVAAAARFTLHWHKAPNPYRQLRQDIGRGILLGLEFWWPPTSSGRWL